MATNMPGVHAVDGTYSVSPSFAPVPSRLTRDHIRTHDALTAYRQFAAVPTLIVTLG